MIDVTTAEGLELVLGVARSAAREAAALALQGFRQAPQALHKGEIDLVTKYDLASEELLRRRLREALPFAIVGEEQAGEADRITLYVDPIDGTTNFVHGHPFWCVSIGLVVDRLPVLGVVVSPPLGLEWCGFTAADGRRHATRNEAVCTVSQAAALDDAMLATGFPYDRRTSEENNFEEFTAIKRQCRAIRRCGSAAIDLCLVADGTYDGYWEMKLGRWDIAGGTAIVRAAGGRVTDYDGGDSFIETGRLIATNGAIHDALHGALRRVRAGLRK